MDDDDDLCHKNYSEIIFIVEQPIIHNEESTLYGAKGDLVIKIPCNVTGFPEPTIDWKIDSKSLNMGK